MLEQQYPDRKIIIADNVYEVINNVENILPSPIIISHDTPLMNGVQLVETLVKGNESELKIIVLVDEITENLEKAYKRLGDITLIQKSKTEEQLPDALSRIVV